MAAVQQPGMQQPGNNAGMPAAKGFLPGGMTKEQVQALYQVRIYIHIDTRLPYEHSVLMHV